ncbi:hypothetical protein C8R43DRAFT_941698 [Mycena crocata]|nr:hypothetical protein C8R43DRAFT_941698 [Mycena crocata]
MPEVLPMVALTEFATRSGTDFCYNLISVPLFQSLTLSWGPGLHSVKGDFTRVALEGDPKHPRSLDVQAEYLLGLAAGVISTQHPITNVDLRHLLHLYCDVIPKFFKAHLASIAHLPSTSIDRILASFPTTLSRARLHQELVRDVEDYDISVVDMLLQYTVKAMVAGHEELHELLTSTLPYSDTSSI